jgi:hypothetical protein
MAFTLRLALIRVFRGLQRWNFPIQSTVENG